MSIRTINGITIIGTTGNCTYINSKNKSRFTVNEKGVYYYDDFGNYMTSTSRFISINFENFKLQEMGDEIRKSDGTVMIMMPKKEIQEIANKTFYEEGQFQPVDFLSFLITEQKQ